jgi:hypothetical protein
MAAKNLMFFFTYFEASFLNVQASNMIKVLLAWKLFFGGKPNVNSICNRHNIKIYKTRVEFNLSSRTANLLRGFNALQIHCNKYGIDKNIIKKFVAVMRFMFCDMYIYMQFVVLRVNGFQEVWQFVTSSHTHIFVYIYLKA